METRGCALVCVCVSAVCLTTKAKGCVCVLDEGQAAVQLFVSVTRQTGGPQSSECVVSQV